LNNQLSNLKIFNRKPVTGRARPEMVLLTPAAVEEVNFTQAGQDQSLFMSGSQQAVAPSSEIDPEAVADLVLEMLEADLKTDYERRGGGFNS
jgi:hypothetical protein